MMLAARAGGVSCGACIVAFYTHITPVRLCCSWNAGKKFIGSSVDAFLKSLVNFDRDNIPGARALATSMKKRAGHRVALGTSDPSLKAASHCRCVCAPCPPQWPAWTAWRRTTSPTPTSEPTTSAASRLPPRASAPGSSTLSSTSASTRCAALPGVRAQAASVPHCVLGARVQVVAPKRAALADANKRLEGANKKLSGIRAKVKELKVGAGILPSPRHPEQASCALRCWLLDQRMPAVAGPRGIAGRGASSCHGAEECRRGRGEWVGVSHHAMLNALPFPLLHPHICAGHRRLSARQQRPNWRSGSSRAWRASTPAGQRASSRWPPRRATSWATCCSAHRLSPTPASSTQSCATSWWK